MNYTVRKRLICDWTNDYVYDIMDGEKLIRSCIGTLKMTIAIAKEKGWELDIDFYQKQAMSSDDLKQYMTNLLYYAFEEGRGKEAQEVNRWIEEKMNGIDEYFKSLQPKDNSHNNKQVEICTECNNSLLVYQFSREVRISKCVKCGK